MTIKSLGALSTGLSRSTPLQDFPLLLPKWSAALAKVKAGKGDATIVGIGDSVMFGYRASDASSGDYKSGGWMAQLAARMTAQWGIAAHDHSFFGAGNSGANTYQYDPRITKGSSWSPWSSSNTINGLGYTAIDSTNALSFTPNGNVDTFDTYYVQNPSGTNSMDLDINGGAVTNVNTTNAANGIVKATITGVLGTNTLNIKRNTGTTNIVGVNAYDSTVKQVNILNGGWPSSFVINWNDISRNYGPLNGSAALAPDLTIISLTINDEVSLTSVSSYTSSLQAIITKMKTVGDVMLLIANPIDTALATTAEQQIYNNINFSLAASNNIPILDTWSMFGSYSSANSLGLMQDTLHPKKAGHAKIANALANVLNV